MCVITNISYCVFCLLVLQKRGSCFTSYMKLIVFIFKLLFISQPSLYQTNKLIIKQIIYKLETENRISEIFSVPYCFLAPVPFNLDSGPDFSEGFVASPAGFVAVSFFGASFFPSFGIFKSLWLITGSQTRMSQAMMKHQTG